MTLLFVLGFLVVGLMVAAKDRRPASAGSPGRSATITVRLIGLMLAVSMGFLSLIGTALILLAGYFMAREDGSLGILTLLFLPFLGFCLMGVGILVYRRSDRQMRRNAGNRRP